MSCHSKVEASVHFANLSSLVSIYVQGIVNPLMVQKTDKRGGTIVNSPAAQAAAAAAAEAAPPAKKAKVSFLGPQLSCNCNDLAELNSCAAPSICDYFEKSISFWLGTLRLVQLVYAPSCVTQLLASTTQFCQMSKGDLVESGSV